MLITKRTYKKKYVIGGAGIFGSIGNSLARMFSSNAAKQLASTALQAGKTAAKDIGMKAIDVGKTVSIDAGKKLINIFLCFFLFISTIFFRYQSSFK